MNKTHVQLIGINYDAKSSFMRGAAQAPGKIREVLHDGSSSYLSENGCNIIEDIIWEDAGDIEVGDYPNLFPAIKKKLKPGSIPVFLGGDHSISYPIVKAMATLHKDFSILHFDAHTDLYDVFEGDKFSHACPFARIMEEGLAAGLTQVGIRVLNQHHIEQAEKYGVRIIPMRKVEDMYSLTFDKPVYLSLDLDVFDPAFVPGVSHHEPGGMLPRQFINFLHETDMKIIGADIVEYNPFRDVSDITAALAAKMLKEIVGKMAISG